MNLTNRIILCRPQCDSLCQAGRKGGDGTKTTLYTLDPNHPVFVIGCAVQAQFCNAYITVRKPLTAPYDLDPGIGVLGLNNK
jgi:hypothetical protein